MADETKKYRNLIDSLFSKSSADEIEWLIDPWDDKLCSHLGKYKIRLTDTRNADGEPIEWAEIVDDDDNIIDRFSDESISGVPSPHLNNSNYFLVMRKLRTMAERKARGADEALDEILDILKDSDE